MELVIETEDDGLGLLDELVNIHLVRDIRIKVILEMLNHVHTGLHGFVSSNSWEGEGLVEELPSVDLWWLHSEFLGDLHSIEIVLLSEFS